jgi:hypothetical protein
VSAGPRVRAEDRPSIPISNIQDLWQAFLREAEALGLDLVFPADPFAR